MAYSWGMNAAAPLAALPATLVSSDAPAQRLVATHCACCGRKLKDAASVEAGVGPECRETHGYGVRQGTPDWAAYGALVAGTAHEANADNVICDARAVANDLVLRLACAPEAPEASAYVLAVQALGFARLAKRLVRRLGGVVVEAEGEGPAARLLVKSPFSRRFLAAMGLADVRGTWDRTREVWVVPADRRARLWAALKNAFDAGTLVAGTRVARL